MNWNAQKDFRLITGKSRTGKTTLYLEQVNAPGAKFHFIFDPDREYAFKCGVGTCTTIDHMVWAISNKRPAAFDPNPMFPGNPKEGFAFWSRWVMSVCRKLKGVKRVAVDEIWKVTTTGKSGIPTAFMEIMNEGARNEIEVRLISQSLNEVNLDIRKQLDLIYTFQHSEPGCLDWLEERGFNRKEVETLPPKGVYLVRDVNICVTKRGGKFNPNQKCR